MTSYRVLSRMHSDPTGVRAHAERLLHRLDARSASVVGAVARGRVLGATRSPTFRGTAPATRIQPAAAVREALGRAGGGA